MSKIKSAVQKKQLSYERDHFSASEYPKAFRKNWPRKKARANRALRREVTQIIDSTLHEKSPNADELAVEHVARKRVKKFGAESLRERVQRTQKRRQTSRGAKKARRARSAKTNP